MSSFQGKIDWKMPRKREYKIYRSVSFLPNAKLKIPKKIAKKFKKLNNTILWLHYKPKLVGKRREREKIKIIVLFRSDTTRNRKFQKNSKKIRKTKQYQSGFISSQNRLLKAKKEKK